jgi:hypothetical protein
VLNLTQTQQAGDKTVFSSHCVFVASNECASQHRSLLKEQTWCLPSWKPSSFLGGIPSMGYDLGR